MVLADIATQLDELERARMAEGDVTSQDYQEFIKVTVFIFWRELITINEGWVDQKTLSQWEEWGFGTAFVRKFMTIRASYMVPLRTVRAFAIVYTSYISCLGGKWEQKKPTFGTYKRLFSLILIGKINSTMLPSVHKNFRKWKRNILLSGKELGKLHVEWGMLTNSIKWNNSEKCRVTYILETTW